MLQNDGWTALSHCQSEADTNALARCRVLMNALPLNVLVASAERERERLHTGIEELDLELSIDDRLRLSD